MSHNNNVICSGDKIKCSSDALESFLQGLHIVPFLPQQRLFLPVNASVRRNTCISLKIPQCSSAFSQSLSHSSFQTMIMLLRMSCCKTQRTVDSTIPLSKGMAIALNMYSLQALALLFLVTFCLLFFKKVSSRSVDDRFQFQNPPRISMARSASRSPAKRSRSGSRSSSPRRKPNQDRTHRGADRGSRRSHSPNLRARSPGRRSASPRRRDSRSPPRGRRSPRRSRSREGHGERRGTYDERRRWDGDERREGRDGRDRRPSSRWEEDGRRMRESHGESDRHRQSDSRRMEGSSQREGGRGGGGGPRSFVPPPLYSIHKGKIVRIADFGCFVDLEDMGTNSKWGLVHVSQILQQKVLLINKCLSMPCQIFPILSVQMSTCIRWRRGIVPCTVLYCFLFA
jgi:hypothetical protein